MESITTQKKTPKQKGAAFFFTARGVFFSSGWPC
jgi:hypothetical protein